MLRCCAGACTTVRWFHAGVLNIVNFNSRSQLKALCPLMRSQKEVKRYSKNKCCPSSVRWRNTCLAEVRKFIGVWENVSW